MVEAHYARSNARPASSAVRDERPPEVLVIAMRVEPADGLRTEFARHRFSSVFAQDLDDGRRFAEKTDFDAVLVELHPTEIGAHEIFTLARELEGRSAVLALDPDRLAENCVLCLDAGADDYLAWPCSIGELLARLRAATRRTNRMRSSPQCARRSDFRRGEFLFAADTHEVVVDGNKLNLTPTEFKLLRVLAERPNEAITRAELIAQVWGSDFDGYDHTLSSHINRLRGKIERDASTPDYIVTVKGVGYRFCDRLR